MKEGKLTRRDLLSAGATGAAALMLGGGSAAEPGRSAVSPDVPPMPTRPLGQTGHDVGLFSLGGQATLEIDGMQDESEAIINRAIDLGVNYIDTAAAYGAPYGYPVSQTHIGAVMATRRDEVFLATKTHDRTRDGSLALLDQSLTLLQTDHLDLWQIHNIKYIEQLDQVFGTGGAIEALQEAKDDGTVSFLGITGHFDPDILMEGMRRFDFDCLLTSVNAADAHWLPFARNLLPMANEKNMGVIGMKIPARGRIFRDGGITTMTQAMSYTLTLPVSTVIVGCDNIAQLEENVSIAKSFTPLTYAEMQQLTNLTADYWEYPAWHKRSGMGFFTGEDDQQTD
jgi:aryl-alcohol dehydrogenase-like predicted oxidoreductase